ncbi:tRNA/rRNA methyltransferase YfiF [Salmonella enterica subsp. arizonae]|uniref:tRNA/rRNA methyltransferase YfiF n=1 Tax=Salmonella enterica subsp. arizonae TaxID=59203 RepID=A0A3S5DFX8_SALER|nr:tRNA/rRNA methyltransferase YfiF [Salmonella enterica subsp. arizonae]
MAANRKAYHVVDEAELAKASGTEHHGGVCFLIKKRNGTTVKQWVKQAADQDCVLALEDVANPHNLGGMMRSCAHFGVKGVVVQDAALLESGAAIRTAEGGAEHVQPITGESIVDVLDDFRQAGYTVVTTSSDRGQALFSTTLPEKMVLVLGREYDFLPEAAREPNDLCVKLTARGTWKALMCRLRQACCSPSGGGRIKRKGYSPVAQRVPGQLCTSTARSDKALSRRYPGDKTASRQRYSLSVGSTGVQSIVFSPCCSSHWFVSAK